jgi:hypothetical protein
MRWRLVVSFTPQLFFPQGKKKSSIGSWIGFRAGQDVLEKKVPLPVEK